MTKKRNLINEQLTILKKTFPKVKIVLPKEIPELPSVAEDLALIPHWTLIADTYPAAVQNVLDVLQKSRPFYNYRDGEIDESHLRELPLKAQLLSPYVNSTFALPVQTGKRWKGESVKTVRERLYPKEIPLGAYEVGIVLLTHPDQLTKWEDLWIDCPGDEFSPDADGRFVGAPVFGFFDGKLGFGTGGFDRAVEHYGSVSGFLPQFESGTLASIEPFDSLALYLRVKNLERDMEKLKKIITILKLL